ncbi:MAG: hypothetical protein KJ998_14700, partial [Gammaproteobacteria bacterium]|nr:hypothetical protein [Gammaproteobacteria bacterium]
MVRWIILLFFFASCHVAAFEFSVTESEFNSWDKRCKTAYAGSIVGRNSRFFRDMTPQQSAEARKFGEAAGGAWHYCAGLILLQRAASTIGNERNSNLQSALLEIRFTYNKIKPEHPWYAEVHIDYAKALITSGDKRDGFAVLNRLIQTLPDNSLPYTALAFYLRRENKLEQAIECLQSAPELLKNDSAELNYFLGWYSMEAGNIGSAVDYAKRAYELNYPVQALKLRLAQQKEDKMPELTEEDALSIMRKYF